MSLDGACSIESLLLEGGGSCAGQPFRRRVGRTAAAEAPPPAAATLLMTAVNVSAHAAVKHAGSVFLEASRGPVWRAVAGPPLVAVECA